jgi:hypothetical protein
MVDLSHHLEQAPPGVHKTLDFECPDNIKKIKRKMKRSQEGKMAHQSVKDFKRTRNLSGDFCGANEDGRMSGIMEETSSAFNFSNPSRGSQPSHGSNPSRGSNEGEGMVLEDLPTEQGTKVYGMETVPSRTSVIIGEGKIKVVKLRFLLMIFVESVTGSNAP